MAEYYFNLPTIPALTISQQAALDESGQISISGGPGTGKSVVSLWRHIRNFQSTPKKKSLLLTYTTTLKEYLASTCRTQSIEASNYVGTSLKNSKLIKQTKFDEIIVDEAQDLGTDFYIDIKSKVSYGADDAQILYPEHSSTLQELKSIFPNNVDYVLSKNFRSTKAIMQFAKTLFVKAVVPSEVISDLAIRNPGEKPILMISNGNIYDRTNDKQNSAIIEIIKEYSSDTENVAILVPWKSDVQVFESVLSEYGIEEFSVYYEDKEQFPSGCESIQNVHITTFKSAKGLEFDTVIIPNFHKYNEILGNFNVEWKDFYVGCTRAKSNLFLISNYNMPNLDGVVEKIEL